MTACGRCGRKLAIGAACACGSGQTHDERYGYDHRRLRRGWQKLVDHGTVRCARCGELIQPGSEWHLDHADDGVTYLGPSHATCNQRAGAATTNGGR